MARTAGASLLLAQLTDTHVVDPDEDQELFVDNNGRLAEAVASIGAESVPVDAILATGDLTNNGKPAEFDALDGLLADVGVPILALPGNHDDVSAVKERFGDIEWVDEPHASWETILGGVRIVGLDSTRPGHEGGQFDAQREAWLRSTLSAPTEAAQTVLAMHHPPFRTGIEWMDRSGFDGLAGLIGALDDHPVDRIVCGHVHRSIQSVVAGIPAQVGLSTVHHVALDLRPDASIRLVRDPAGYLLHRFEGRSSVTHTRYIATGEEPFPPSWAPD